MDCAQKSMLTQRRLSQDMNGFTLIELMVAVAASTIVVAAGYTILTATSKATRANDQAAGTQYNARVAMERLSRDIRMAGFGMTGPVGNCNTAIVPRDNTPGGPDTGPDTVSLVVPAVSTANAAWTLTAEAKGPTTTLTLTAASVNDMVTSGLKKRINTVGPPATTTPGSTLSIGGVISVEVSDYSGGTITLLNTLVSPASFPAGTPVYLLKCMTYQVILPPDANGVCGGTAPCLVQGEAAAINNCDVAAPNPCSPIVDGIEDLQLAYACDGCNITPPNPASADGVIDDQGTMSGTFDQADFLSNTNWATPPLTPDKIRLVQVSIVGRQTATEIGMGETVKAGTNSAAVVLPDHNHANDASFMANPTAYQQLRRRLLIHTVETRNLES